jgi:hypothetical protein
MKSETNIKAIQAVAFDWIKNALIALLCFFVKDMHSDIKQLIQSVPALRAEVDMLKDQRLIEKFRRLNAPPAKSEDEITYDTLKR